MTPLEFEEILKKTDSYTDYIYLHVKGEPLLHPNLKEILELSELIKLNSFAKIDIPLYKINETSVKNFPYSSFLISLNNSSMFILHLSKYEFLYKF